MDKPTWASDHSLEYVVSTTKGLWMTTSLCCRSTAVTTYGERKSRTCASPQTDPEKENVPEAKTTVQASEVDLRNVGMHACTQIILTPEIIKV